MAEGPRVDRVLMVAPCLTSRGTSEYALSLARRLPDLGVAVSVFCGPGPMVQALRDSDAECQVFEHVEALGLHVLERRRLVAACADWHPSIVHAQALRVAGASITVAAACGVPGVVTAHWVPPERRRVRRVCRRMAGVIAASQAVREGLVNDCGVARNRIRVIHNGVDIDRLDGDRVGPIFGTRVPVVGSLGPIEERRGHELFVRAVALVAKRLPGVQFVVAGEGHGLPALRRLVAGLGLDRRVTLATDFGSYADVLEALDVVVQSSQVDVSGFSILEAMSYGRPVIAFNTGTACEIVEDGKTGLLIPKGDVEALAAAISRLLEDRGTAVEMGAAARATVAEKFDARTLARATLDYYEDVLEGG